MTQGILFPILSDRGVITTKATKAAALVDFWDYKHYKNWPKQLGRFEEKNIFIFLPSIENFADLKK